MNKTKRAVRIGAVAGVLVLAAWSFVSVQTLHVPPGFQIEQIPGTLRGVRTIRFGPDGMLYAVQSRDGRVVRLDPSDARRPQEVAAGLNRPYGLAFHDGWMYVGETDAIVRFRAPDYTTRQTVVEGIPGGGGHWAREIAFGPDGMLYVSIGSTCNVCEEDDPRRASVVRYGSDGSDETLFAEGLRNASGLAFHPETGVLWASQNERDNLGDDLPLEEINILSEGDHFGWPYCYGDRVPNPEYPDRTSFCRGTVAPAFGLTAHAAPLGMVFYTGEQFPEEYRGDLFVALHGSWNRSERSGYKLVRISVEAGRPVAVQDFATGWLSRGRVTGRPVYPAVGPDGSLYLSEDEAGRIYRIHWVG